MYHIGGRKNLANTFGLFQLGREVLISGNIVGYTEQEYMWIVAVLSLDSLSRIAHFIDLFYLLYTILQAISVSVTLGHQSNVSQHSRPSERVQPYTRQPGLSVHSIFTFDQLVLTVIDLLQNFAGGLFSC
jgi:hypothetical protein